ncbi:hypothetical protein L1987_56540 [Smallanthus sonchifolius]|uniref:Uncharacterized protein n=1 Tax=Smallanthus sonchifolius TaxID=185202 RepID=A0ACB9EDS3_9ASTR|nr:hypothetical protein L1987_56540 [Smallanthus sonchifolius]
MAKILLNRDQRLSITVLLINPFYSFPILTTYIQSLAKNTIERIRFIELPQDQTPPKSNPKAPITSFYEFINTHCKYVRNIVADMINLNQTGSSKVVGFVVDILCVGTIDVANEFNVPTYVFFTANSAYLGFNLFIERLFVDQKQDVIEMSNSEGEMVVPWFVNPVSMKVVRTVCKIDEGLDVLVYSFREMRKAKGIMVNTFLELESHAIKSFAYTNFPPVYPVGPVLNLDGVAGKADDSEVLSWLDGQPSSSVVVLCFGSMGCFNEVQVKEIARGLERSGQRFVWSLRRPALLEQSLDDPKVLLPDGFLERDRETCGLVYTATWPMYAEEQMNAFEMVVELGLAVDLKMDYKIDLLNPDDNIEIVTEVEIERGIRRLTEDNEIRAKVKEMSKLSRATVAEGGSSYASVGYLVQEIMSNII